MIKIEIYTLLDSTVTTVETTDRSESASEGRPTRWISLSYSRGPLLAHSETDELIDQVSEAIREGERQAAEHGGWSLLT